MTGNGERLGRDAMRGTLLAGILGAATAAGQVLGPDFTSAELKCQNGIAAAESKLLDARTKCVAKCLKAARAGEVPASDCQGPAFGGATATCVLDSEKGAEAKAVAAIGKACRTDCPECYPGADCAARATQVVGEVSAAADAQILPFVYCGVQTALTKDEAKCEDTTAKAVTKLAGGIEKCAAKCKSAESKGEVAVGACAPPAQDMKTADCVGTAQDKAVAAIGKVCGVARPGCYPQFASTLFPGVVTSVFQARYAPTWCGG